MLPDVALFVGPFQALADGVQGEGRKVAKLSVGMSESREVGISVCREVGELESRDVGMSVCREVWRVGMSESWRVGN